ncbi:PadR family transcriptional regulator [Nocardia brasiliensis]|uniref:PadR family transcriptional regulator n=1 Tax=Nocardia brasiliensis TaxID=37326 RepID=UPI001894832B|nr:helix-turn-helix transcriptional regulator [Nocardia brasiliensis]MBF6548846.1 helix-turn-helix transcriptional regulator [Nocardia brasiliensis]
MREIRMTLWTVVVLREFVVNATEPQYGFDLMKRCDLPSGTLYPILTRLEDAGWIVGQLEVIDAVKEGRRPRKYYLLTPTAFPMALRALREFTTRAQPPLSPEQVKIRESRRRKERQAAERAREERAAAKRAAAELARERRETAARAKRDLANAEEAKALWRRQAQQEADRRAAAALERESREFQRQVEFQAYLHTLEQAKQRATAEFHRRAREARELQNASSADPAAG